MFHIVSGSNAVAFNKLIIDGGRGIDDGTSGEYVSTLPTTMGTGGGIL